MKLLASREATEAADVVAAIVTELKGQWPARDFFERDPSRIWQELVSGEWLALGVPEGAGGAGFGLLDLATVVEAWGRHLVPLPYVPTMLLARWAGGLPADLRETRLTYAIPNRPSGDEGASVLVPFATVSGTRVAGALVPFSLLPPVSVAQGGSPRDDAGDVAHGGAAEWAPSLPLGRGGQATAGLPPEALVEIAVLGAAELLGVGSAVLDQTIAYAKEREQFGQRIGDFQGVAHRLANMHRDLEMARTALVWAVNEPSRFELGVAIAWDRVRCMTEDCMQVHGGFGFTWEAGLHFYVRHVWTCGRVLAACGVRLWPV